MHLFECVNYIESFPIQATIVIYCGYLLYLYIEILTAQCCWAYIVIAITFLLRGVDILIPIYCHFKLQSVRILWIKIRAQLKLAGKTASPSTSNSTGHFVSNADVNVNCWHQQQFVRLTIPLPFPWKMCFVHNSTQPTTVDCCLKWIYLIASIFSS